MTMIMLQFTFTNAILLSPSSGTCRKIWSQYQIILPWADFILSRTIQKNIIRYPKNYQWQKLWSKKILHQRRERGKLCKYRNWAGICNKGQLLN